MCRVHPFTFPCCRRVYVDVEHYPSCPASWPEEKCPAELTIQTKAFEPEHRSSGICWRCSGSPEPAFNYAKVTLGLEERTPQDRRRETEEGGACWSCNSAYDCHQCGSKKPDPYAVLDRSKFAPTPPPPTKNVRRRPESAYDVKKRTRAKGKDIKKEINTRARRSSSLRTPARVTKPYNHPPQARTSSSQGKSTFYGQPKFPGYPPSGTSFLPSPADSMRFMQSPIVPDHAQPSMYPSLPATPPNHLQDAQSSFNGMSHMAYAANNSPVIRGTYNNGFLGHHISPAGSYRALSSSPLTKMETASDLSPKTMYGSPTKLGSPFQFVPRSSQTAQNAQNAGMNYGSRPRNDSISEEARLDIILQHMPQNDGLTANFDHLQQSPVGGYTYHNARYALHSDVSDRGMQEKDPDITQTNENHLYVSATSHLVINS
jgi:hypothetical protein